MTGDVPPSPSADHDAHRWVTAALRQYEGGLVLYAARITRDRERARDVVQEAFLRLLREDRAAIEPRLAEWLYTVCRNRALDIRRKESRMRGLNDDSLTGQWLSAQPGHEPSPDAALEQQEAASHAMVQLSRLPENQQEVIRLKFQHGLSYKEISGVTKLTVTNVGFLIHTGLKTLRERMTV